MGAKAAKPLKGTRFCLLKTPRAAEARREAAPGDAAPDGPQARRRHPGLPRHQDDERARGGHQQQAAATLISMLFLCCWRHQNWRRRSPHAFEETPNSPHRSAALPEPFVEWALVGATNPGWRCRRFQGPVKSRCVRSRRRSPCPPCGRRASSSWAMRARRSAARARASPRSRGTP